MASLRGVARTARGLPLTRHIQPTCQIRRQSTGAAAAAAAAPAPRDVLADLETDSTLLAPVPGVEDKADFRPWKRAADRKGLRLPSSSYQYHPPKYTRGPLHPIQSPPSSDPIARDFVPGPFNFPRLRQTFQTTIASDLMTLAYNHTPPGTPEREPAERLRTWDDSSPYHKNRDRRAPRGSPNLTIIEKDITFRNIPELKSITIASFVPVAINEPDRLLVARTALLAITGVLPDITKSKNDVQAWALRKNHKAGVKSTMYGNAAYEFLDRCLHLVFPRIKDWKGIKGKTTLVRSLARSLAPRPGLRLSR